MKIFCVFVVLLSPLLALGQMDSIPFGKVKKSAGVYALNHWGIDAITFISEKPFPLHPLEKEKKGFGKGFWTLLTGLSTYTLNESVWIFPNSLQFSRWENSLYTPLVVTGALEKTRHRVKDDEGYTVETEEQLLLQLDAGAWGWLVNRGDTLGSFRIVKRQNTDSRRDWAGYMGNIEWLKDKLKKYGALETTTDFLIEGVLHDQPFLLAYSGQYFRSALIDDHRPVAIWQDTPNVVMSSKKHRIQPHVQVPASVSDKNREEILMLLALGQMVARNLEGL